MKKILKESLAIEESEAILRFNRKAHPYEIIEALEVALRKLGLHISEYDEPGDHFAYKIK